MIFTIKYFELATDKHPDEIDKIKAELDNGANPRDIKLRLARIFVSLYHAPEDVKKAVEYYDKAFAKKGIPDDIPEVFVNTGQVTIAGIIPALIEMGFVKSKSEFMRLVNQGGVQFNGEKLVWDDADKIINCGDVMKIGKKRFMKFFKKP